MVGGTSFPPHDSESEPWSNEQKAKATPKPSTKGKSKPEAALPERSRLATRSLEVSLDNADRVIEGAPHIRVFCECVGEGRAPAAARILVLRTKPTHRKVRDECGTRLHIRLCSYRPRQEIDVPQRRSRPAVLRA